MSALKSIDRRALASAVQKARIVRD